MEIHKLNNMTARGSKGGKGYFIHVTRQEALKLITSLSEQMVANDSNHNRLESYTDKGEYVSIGVVPEYPPECRVCHRPLGKNSLCYMCDVLRFESFKDKARHKAPRKTSRKG